MWSNNWLAIIFIASPCCYIAGLVVYDVAKSLIEEKKTKKKERTYGDLP